jgi:RNA polymerase sigma factor (sigma-70 family)
MNEMETEATQKGNPDVIPESSDPVPDTPPFYLNLKTIYHREVGRSRRLCESEERAITEIAGAGGEGAAATLATSYLKMVIKFASIYARRFPYPGTVYLDLIQEGNIALLLAARRFSSNYGAPFYSYARVAVERAIRRALSKNFRRFSDLPLEETLSAETCMGPDVTSRETIQELLSTLPRLEREVIELRFGLLDGERRTLRDISFLLNINRHKVRQILETGIMAMRKIV